MCQNLLRKKTSLKKFKPSDVGLREETPLFITESLMPLLQGFVEQMQRINEKIIYSSFTINGNVKYTLGESGKVYTATHKKFPNAYCG